MIWLHGGGFSNGAAAVYQGSHLARSDIIVVMVQYRLGMFGFMNTWDTTIDDVFGGNYGLMDQQLAIKFIHDNAEYIGGDADNINLVGESSGGQAVAFQLLNTVSSKMIKTAFSQSGM